MDAVAPSSIYPGICKLKSRFLEDFEGFEGSTLKAVMRAQEQEPVKSLIEVSAISCTVSRSHLVHGTKTRLFKILIS